MNDEVWKYRVDLPDGDPTPDTRPTILPMPSGAVILTATFDGGGLWLWAICNPGAPRIDRRILVIGTGVPLPPDPHGRRRYIATVLAPPFVWHVFEC